MTNANTTMTVEQLDQIQMTVWKAGRLVMNPVYLATFGRRGSRTAAQQANFDAVQSFNRCRVGVGQAWNS